MKQLGLAVLLLTIFLHIALFQSERAVAKYELYELYVQRAETDAPYSLGYTIEEAERYFTELMVIRTGEEVEFKVDEDTHTFSYNNGNNHTIYGTYNDDDNRTIRLLSVGVIAEEGIDLFRFATRIQMMIGFPREYRSKSEQSLQAQREVFQNLDMKGVKQGGSRSFNTKGYHFISVNNTEDAKIFHATVGVEGDPLLSH